LSALTSIALDTELVGLASSFGQGSPIPLRRIVVIHPQDTIGQPRQVRTRHGHDIVLALPAFQSQAPHVGRSGIRIEILLVGFTELGIRTQGRTKLDGNLEQHGSWQLGSIRGIENQIDLVVASCNVLIQSRVQDNLFDLLVRFLVQHLLLLFGQASSPTRLGTQAHGSKRFGQCLTHVLVLFKEQKGFDGLL